MRHLKRQTEAPPIDSYRLRYDYGRTRVTPVTWLSIALSYIRYWIAHLASWRVVHTARSH